ncbi:hypothetical protein [Clostridium sp. DL-VIII]|nr:hypothetical protein [Clostridium sp. DL-VIII]
MYYIIIYVFSLFCGLFTFAIINIGTSKSGKSMMKNLITGLFDVDV